jgi:hypothetical protein
MVDVTTGLTFLSETRPDTNETSVAFHFNVPSAFRRATGLDGQGSIPGKCKRFFLLRVVQTGSGVHSASYPMGTAGSFVGRKTTGA